jgi:hypothetical protein
VKSQLLVDGEAVVEQEGERGESIIFEHPDHDLLANGVIGSNGAAVKVGIEEVVENAGGADKRAEVLEAFEIRSHLN